MIDIVGLFTHIAFGFSIPLAGAPAAGSAAVAQAPATVNANDAVQSVQKFYANVTRVKAKFRQSVSYATFGSSKESGGNVWLMKPGKMRWDYSDTKANVTKVKKSFISNGKTLFVVEHDNKQVTKKNLEQDLMPVAVSFLYGSGDLAKEFNADVDKSGAYGTKGDLVLKLTPKRPSAQYKNLYLVVNGTDFHVKESVIIDSSNNVNHFMFYAPEFDGQMKDSWFEFNPASVPTYRVIDADQAAKGSGIKQ